jgi:hypothetical protein
MAVMRHCENSEKDTKWYSLNILINVLIVVLIFAMILIK